jgi:hypothetical protein
LAHMLKVCSSSNVNWMFTVIPLAISLLLG